MREEIRRRRTAEREKAEEALIELADAKLLPDEVVGSDIRADKKTGECYIRIFCFNPESAKIPQEYMGIKIEVHPPEVLHHGNRPHGLRNRE